MGPCFQNHFLGESLQNVHHRTRTSAHIIFGDSSWPEEDSTASKGNGSVRVGVTPMEISVIIQSGESPALIDDPVCSVSRLPLFAAISQPPSIPFQKRVALTRIYAHNSAMTSLYRWRQHAHSCGGRSSRVVTVADRHAGGLLVRFPRMAGHHFLPRPSWE